MNFARLDRFATQFDQVLIHPKDWEEVRPCDHLHRCTLTSLWLFNLTKQ